MKLRPCHWIWVMVFFGIFEIPLRAQTEPKFLTEKFKDRVECFIQNSSHGHVTLTVELTLKNAKSSLPVPYTAVVAGLEKAKAMTITPLDPNKEWNYSFKYTWVTGSIHAVHDASHVYRLPYPSGQSYRVMQGFNGKFSHTKELAYAIDWKMPEGSPICAARDGVVVEARSVYADGGTNRAVFINRANRIWIQHGDHTIGEYDHLKQSGVLVKPGQKVKAGDVIGYSGNTGYTSGPHLHFMVSRARPGNQRESIPIRFNAVEGTSLVLSEREKYTAP